MKIRDFRKEEFGFVLDYWLFSVSFLGLWLYWVDLSYLPGWLCDQVNAYEIIGHLLLPALCQ